MKEDKTLTNTLTNTVTTDSHNAPSASSALIGLKMDVHNHIMLFGKNEESSNADGFIHPRFMNSIQMKTYLKTLGLIGNKELLMGIASENLPQLGEAYKAKQVEDILFSELDHAILLGMDGIYDGQGKLDTQKTMFYVSNQAIVAFAKHNAKILPAGSINPLRQDWREELDYCIQEKVALIKWLPSVMGFDPASEKFKAFYRQVSDARIPLLSHVGFEFAVPTVNDSYTQLEHLRLPLEMGVTVIAAHCCGGRPFIDNPKDFIKLVRMLEQYPNLYIDVAGMASIHRKARLKNSLAHPDTKERIVYGSDYPIPIHTWAFLHELGKKEYRNISNDANPLRQDLAIKRALGLEEVALQRGYDIINPQCVQFYGQYRKKALENVPTARAQGNMQKDTDEDKQNDTRKNTHGGR